MMKIVFSFAFVQEGCNPTLYERQAFRKDVYHNNCELTSLTRLSQSSMTRCIWLSRSFCRFAICGERQHNYLNMRTKMCLHFLKQKENLVMKSLVFAAYQICQCCNHLRNVEVHSRFFYDSRVITSISRKSIVFTKNHLRQSVGFSGWYSLSPL